MTLTGPGGAGKTRLAVRVAADVRRAFADGAWQVDLATVRDPALLGYAVVGALDVDDQTDRPVSEVLVEYLRGRHLLLLLDNCEALGGDAFDTEFRRGGALTLDEAAGYALGERQTVAKPADTRAGNGPRLTRRQAEIAELVAQGLSNKQIADRLVISQRTVETHVENILAKFWFTSRVQVAAWYTQRQGRQPPSPPPTE